MNKVSFSQSPAYLTKVKKEQPKKGVVKPFKSETVEEQRHEKINFKQYLRGLEESQASNDEYSDIPLLAVSSIVIEEDRDDDDTLIEQFRVIDFGGEDTKLSINEADWSEIIHLEKDESITVLDEYNDRWYVTRSLTNQLVFENQEYAINGKLDFTETVKRFK